MSALPGAWRARGAGVLAGVLLLALTACTEDALTGIDPDSAPGDAAETIEIELPASALPMWRDTSYLGYALPTTSGVRLVARTTDLRARILARFATIPDSLFIEEERIEIERFEAGRLRLIVDTLASAVPEPGARLSAYSLTRPFASREASWMEAAQGEPWTTAGGDLGALFGTFDVESVSEDTLFLPLAGDTDSLLTAWRASGGDPGLALLTETDGARFTVRQVVLEFDAKPVGRDTLIETLRAATPSTFIFDPETPPPGGALRIGGLPASRAYLSFRLPESTDGVDLRGARINRATLLLTSIGTPPEPFATSDTLFASVFNLLQDPFEVGPKTPVGVNLGNSVEILPEEMAAGGEVALPVTGLVGSWAAAEPEAVIDLHLGVQLLPEGGGLAFWEFADVADPARAPRLRILVTPATRFDLP